MTRALSSSWRRIAVFALLLTALVSSPAFAGKPTVAVLGLEVVDPTGQIDQATTAVARDLTDALRSRAKMPSNPYAFQPGSEKELIDEKLIKNCDNEAISCMSQIGKDLGADFLIYGKFEKKPDGYVVTINLLNISKKKFEKSRSPLTIPHGSAKDPTAIGAAATKAYNDLVGVVANGTLIVRSNADHGTILLDNDPKGSLASGTLTLSLPEGPYRLVVEADGFERSTETKVTIRSGETITQQVTMVESKVTKKPDEISHTMTGTTSSTGTNIWKPIFVASVIVGLGAGSTAVFFKIKMDSAADDAGNDPMTKGLKDDACDGALNNHTAHADFYNACHHRTKLNAALVGTGVSVALIAISGYLAFGRSTETRNPPPATGTVGRRTRKPAFAVTPVISTDGGGAAFRIDW
jgi:PEGA domain